MYTNMYFTKAFEWKRMSRYWCYTYTKNGIRIDCATREALFSMGYTFDDIYGED